MGVMEDEGSDVAVALSATVASFIAFCSVLAVKTSTDRAEYENRAKTPMVGFG